MITQKFTQKYAIIQLFEDIEDGYLFSSDNWPLHSTLVDTFAIDWSAEKMIDELAAVFSKHIPAVSVAENDKYFGPEQKVQVVLLDRTESLVRLHHEVLSVLEKGGLILNDPQYARNGFLPHSTVQKHGRLNKGDIVKFDALTIVDFFPNKDPYKRKILSTINITN